MIVHLVRHGCAGRKGEWAGPDEERPLDTSGVEQAASLAEALQGRPVAALLSSPTRRCRDTLAPLADARGLPVADEALLATPARPDALLELLTGPSCADAVLCTHGEVLSPLLERLRSAGTEVRPAPASDEELLVKGGVWTLHVDGERVLSLDHVVPPAPRACAVHAGTA